MEFLRDPAIQAVIGGISIFITIFALILHRTRRSIIFTVGVDEPFIDFMGRNLTISKNSEIFENALKVKDLRLAVISFKNNGNTPISKNDFESDLRFKFEDSNQVIFAKVIASKPSSILETLVPQVTTNTLEIPRFLLNPKDEFILAVGYTGKVEKFPHPIGRIRGIKDIRNVPLERRYVFAAQILLLIWSVIVLLATDLLWLEVLYIFNLINLSYIVISEAIKRMLASSLVQPNNLFEIKFWTMTANSLKDK